jgi:nicotinate-nucleotide pyrophosphorylase (carboxylating)
MKRVRAELLKRAYGPYESRGRGFEAAAKKEFEERFLADAAVDLTSETVLRGDITVTARFLGKENGIVAGLGACLAFFRRHGLRCQALKKDGERVRRGDILAEVRGRQGTLLSVERTGLNLLQRLSGIATHTHRLVKKARTEGVAVVGTRKTLLNVLDKKAIEVGGGLPHRYSLGDAIMIKDNHLSALALQVGSDEVFDEALRRAFGRAYPVNPHFIELEVPSLEAALQAVQAYDTLRQTATAEPERDNLATIPFVLMLDNFKPGQIRKTVKALKKANLRSAILLEASGGITEATFAKYVKSGVDAISIGALTHSVKALDISLKILPPEAS